MVYLRTLTGQTKRLCDRVPAQQLLVRRLGSAAMCIKKEQQPRQLTVCILTIPCRSRLPLGAVLATQIPIASLLGVCARRSWCLRVRCGQSLAAD